MKGKLNLVSVGPGFTDLITPMAERAIKESDAIVGYELYLTWIKDWIENKEVITTPLTKERERATIALELARQGKKVALLSSGDIGVYAMAALAYEEMSENDDYDVCLVPGITAALACASLLGAPLSHDFATLSLSDLLCPWQWIEERARAIAQADLAVVLYNVQSKARPAGIGKILNILMQHKEPDTVCGVVRNAYRPQEQVGIFPLKDLPNQNFDMFTTIIVGNRFTQRKRNWIFTPRGYNTWIEPANSAGGDPIHLSQPPEKAVWVFSGTSDGNILANLIKERGHKIVISAATEYGQELAGNACPDAFVTGGRIGALARREELRQSQALAIVDATHPYADQISDQLISLATSLNIPYIRYERPEAPKASDALVCDSVEEAAGRAMTAGKRIFLATGSSDIKIFLRQPDSEFRLWFTRTTADPDFVQKAIDSGIPRQRICAMQGPFSQAFNEALWREWQIDCVVTKESGVAGGYLAKQAAAKALSIPLLVIKRPAINYPNQATEFETVLDQLTAQLAEQSAKRQTSKVVATI